MMRVQGWELQPERGEDGPLADMLWKKAEPRGHSLFSSLSVSQDQIARNDPSEE